MLSGRPGSDLGLRQHLDPTLILPRACLAVLDKSLPFAASPPSYPLLTLLIDHIGTAPSTVLI